MLDNRMTGLLGHKDSTESDNRDEKTDNRMTALLGHKDSTEGDNRDEKTLIKD